MADLKASVILFVSDEGETFPVRRFTLTRGSKMTIGRSSSSRLNKDRPGPQPDNGFFDSPVVSRQHAELSFNHVTRSMCIEDLTSMHGTTVNGQKIRPRQVWPVHNKDTISVGGKIVAGEKTYPGRTFRFEYVITSSKPKQSRSADISSYRESRPETLSNARPVEPAVFVVPDSSDESDGENSDSELECCVQSNAEDPQFIKQIVKNPNGDSAPFPSSSRSHVNTSRLSLPKTTSFVSQVSDGAIYVDDDDDDDDDDDNEISGDNYNDEGEDDNQAEGVESDDEHNFQQSAIFELEPPCAKEKHKIENYEPTRSDEDQEEDLDDAGSDSEHFQSPEFEIRRQSQGPDENTLSALGWVALGPLDLDVPDSLAADVEPARPETEILIEASNSKSDDFKNNKETALESSTSHSLSSSPQYGLPTSQLLAVPKDVADDIGCKIQGQFSSQVSGTKSSNCERSSQTLENDGFEETSSTTLRAERNFWSCGSHQPPWTFSDGLSPRSTHDVPYVSHLTPQYHTYYPVNGISQDPYQPPSPQHQVTRSSFYSAIGPRIPPIYPQGYSHSSHSELIAPKLPETAVFLPAEPMFDLTPPVPDATAHAQKVHVQREPQLQKDPSPSLYKLSISNIVDPTPSEGISHLKGKKRKSTEMTAEEFEQEENLPSAPGSSPLSKILNRPIWATKANSAKPLPQEAQKLPLRSHGVFSSRADMQETNSALASGAGNTTQVSFKDAAVDAPIEPPQKKPRTSKTSSASVGSFMLGALVGGIGVISALVSLPESYF